MKYETCLFWQKLKNYKMTQIEKAQYFFEKAYKANERKDYKTAKKDYEKAIELNPNIANVYNSLANLSTNAFARTFNMNRISFNRSSFY